MFDLFTKQVTDYLLFYHNCYYGSRLTFFRPFPCLVHESSRKEVNMKTVNTPGVPPSSTDVERKPSASPLGVVLKEGKEGLRFGPVVTGQVALGKDGCGY